MRPHFDASKGCLQHIAAPPFRSFTLFANVCQILCQCQHGNPNSHTSAMKNLSLPLLLQLALMEEGQGFRKSLTAFQCPETRCYKNLNTRRDPAPSFHANVSRHHIHSRSTKSWPLIIHQNNPEWMTKNANECATNLLIWRYIEVELTGVNTLLLLRLVFL